jgi:streptogramin lyase
MIDMRLTRVFLARGFGLGVFVCALAQPAVAVHISEVPAGTSAPWGLGFGPFATRYLAGGSYLQIGEGPLTDLSILGAVDLREMAVAPDGHVWIVETAANKIWVYNVYDSTIGSFSAPGGPTGVAYGPDGNAWFTEYSGNKIGRITPTGTLVEFPIPTASSHPMGIVLGPGGNLWFVEQDGNKLGTITTAGTITEFPLPSAGALPAGIAASASALAITEPGANKIAFFSNLGFSEAAVPSGLSAPHAITLGPDGAFWFLEYAVSKVGRAAPGEPITDFYIPTGGVHPRQIVASPAGDLWFSEQSTGKLGRVQIHVPGDANGDGTVDVSDVFYLINFLFGAGPAPK